MSARLGLNVTVPECTYLTSAGKKRAREKIRQRSANYKSSRIFAKLSKDHRMGKVDARKLHRSGKVPLTESAKSKAPRKVSTCSICKQLGHRSNNCRMPPESKRPNIEQCHIDIDTMHLADRMGIKAAKRHKQLDLVSFDDWI